MPRLDQDKQKELEPERLQFAKEQIIKLGYDIEFESKSELRFYFKGKTIKFYPYSGWHIGSTIKDGRGIENLIKQIKQ